MTHLHVMQSGLKKDFSVILKPMLIEQGFSHIQLKSCIHNEELWRKERLWFGCSFDWRDQYLEISLGHLYWFRDVMPRVIVLGEYSSYVDFDPYNKFKKEGLVEALVSVKDSFSRALEVYRENYDKILQAKLQPKKGRYVKEYAMALGQEVEDRDLEKYHA